jgi:sec-independent protein translocase protein TatA
MAFIGMEWIVVIITVVLFLFGAKKIPELARSLGRARGEITRGQKLVEMEMLKAEKEARHRPLQETSGTPCDDEPGASHTSPIVQAAEAFGITTEGRSELELKDLIRQRVTGE